ncbi:hypothetical protein [Rhizobium populisoli]|uniref:hypothetical protein n=1 Tax=Rhizobium populisoli TaxID=2859785 RepID=UPI001FEB2F49|nr:hypothetical protein [Rhizobium populisoli]
MSNASMFQLTSPPKIITFDCYGTLVQWYEALEREAGPVLSKHSASDVSASAIIDSFPRTPGN